jgi:hypothetical protein
MKKPIFVIVLLLFCSTANAATYYVSTSGNDSTGSGSITSPWRTISYGESQLSSGDTLILRGGTYTGPSNCNISWNVSGTTLRAYSGETPILDGQFLQPAGFSSPPSSGSSSYPDALYDNIITASGTDITIDGLTIIKSTGGGIGLKNATYSTIQNCHVEYCMHFGIDTGKTNYHGYNANGAKLYSADDAYNTVDSCSVFYCNYARDSKVYNVWGNIKTGIAIHGNGCVVKNCTVAFNPCAGIEVWAGGNHVIEDNIVYGNGLTQIHLACCGRTIVRNNVVYGVEDRSPYTTEYGSSSAADYGVGKGLSVAVETWAAGHSSIDYPWDIGHWIYGNQTAGCAINLHFGHEGTTSNPQYQINEIAQTKIVNNSFVESNFTTDLHDFMEAAISINDGGHLGAGIEIKNNIVFQTTSPITRGRNGTPSEIDFGYNLWSTAPGSWAQDSTDPTYSGYPSVSVSNYLQKTSGWTSLSPGGLDADDFDLQSGAAYAIDSGAAPISISSVSGNQLTLGSYQAYAFWPGDTVYDDDGNKTTVASIDAHNRITVSTATGFTSGDGVAPWFFGGTTWDLGSSEYGDGPQNSLPSVSIDSPSGPQKIAVDGSISFSCTASDPDGSISSYLWTFGSSGIPNDISEDPGNKTFETEGKFTVMVTVTDNSGGEASDSVEIQVGRLASPTMLILPANNSPPHQPEK